MPTLSSNTTKRLSLLFLIIMGLIVYIYFSNAKQATKTLWKASGVTSSSSNDVLNKEVLVKGQIDEKIVIEGNTVIHFKKLKTDNP